MIADLKFQTRNLSNSEMLESSTMNHVYLLGDFVNILKFNRPGELVGKLKKDQWQVKMGSLISVYKETDFEFLERAKKKQQITKVTSKVKKFVKAELDLRGFRYEEALVSLDKYIDDCLLSNKPYASIIHGYGTLTIRKLVKEYLSSNNLVKSFRDGEAGEGGNGRSEERRVGKECRL